MPHRHREVGQPCLHIDAFVIPQAPALDRKGVSQGAQTRATPCVSWPHTSSATPLRKPAPKRAVMQRSTVLGEKEDVGQTLVAQSRSKIGIVAQVIGPTRMQRPHPSLGELRLAKAQ